MEELERALRDLPVFVDNSLAQGLIDTWVQPTGTSSAGYPYLQQTAWECFRDRVPHLFQMGQAVLAACMVAEGALPALPGSEADKTNISHACRVTRQVVFTAAITAPADLWLLRQVLGFFAELGLLQSLLQGDALYPERCRVATGPLQPEELDTDLHFLLSRGIVEQYDESFRLAGHPRVRDLLERITPLFVEHEQPPQPTDLWRRLFAGQSLADRELEVLLELTHGIGARNDLVHNHWVPTLEEVELGYRLVPLVLGMRANNLTAKLPAGQRVRADELSATHPAVAGGALELLTACGWLVREGEGYVVNELGARGFSRGPGPFGIIETYHPYMRQGAAILRKGRGEIWVSRGENVGASQDANRATFERANKALDRFCEATGFQFSVFIEHAIGRGEATRQRFERPGGRDLKFFGADLEDAAIDAAMTEQKAGHLPADMVFVRNADIGKPQILLDAMRASGADTHGAVMLVGNGFHEVRGQDDAGMIEVFRGYHDAGVLLIFTEENALSIDDLRATAWNTYHAGFKYVHEKSGQGLRPAEPRPRQSRLGHPLRAAWSECARAAGYVRADGYCSRTRTIYPYTPRSGVNPSVSVNHFFVPADIAAKLSL